MKFVNLLRSDTKSDTILK